MVQQVTFEQLGQLKLTGMLQAYREQTQQPPVQDLSFDERFSLLVDRELLYRSNRRLRNLLRQAKLRQQGCIENVDYDHPHRNLNKSQFISLANGDFIRHHHNLLITGKTGSGKSYLACAIGNQACRQGWSVRYLHVPRFLEELALTHADGSYTVSGTRTTSLTDNKNPASLFAWINTSEGKRDEQIGRKESSMG